MFNSRNLSIAGPLVLFAVVLMGCSSPAPLNGRQANGRQDKQDPVAETERVDIGIVYPDEATEQAPEKFMVRVSTTKGDFVVAVNREWAPNGADRFYNQVKIGYFKDIAIFRAVQGFMFQFGIHGDPKVSKVWGDANIVDDKYAGISNTPGRVTFARSDAPDSRSTQMFVNLGDNAFLDTQGFTPFGEVVEGMDVVTAIHITGENSPEVQPSLTGTGNEFIKAKYPDADYITSMVLLDENGEPIEGEDKMDATGEASKEAAKSEEDKSEVEKEGDGGGDGEKVENGGDGAGQGDGGQ